MEFIRASARVYSSDARKTVLASGCRGKRKIHLQDAGTHPISKAFSDTAALGGSRSWLRGVDLNHRPLGYESNLGVNPGDAECWKHRSYLPLMDGTRLGATPGGMID